MSLQNFLLIVGVIGCTVITLLAVWMAWCFLRGFFSALREHKAKGLPRTRDVRVYPGRDERGPHTIIVNREFTDSELYAVTTTLEITNYASRGNPEEN